MSNTHIVQINVGSTIVRQNKISDRVCALNRVLVSVKGVQEPGVLGSDEFARLFVGPELECRVSKYLPRPLRLSQPL